MLLTVTQHDIDEGERHDGSLCPVAIAVRHAFPLMRIHVDHRGITVTNPEGEHPSQRWETPAFVQDWLLQYDTYKRVRPFQFFLGADRPISFYEEALCKSKLLVAI